MSTNVEIQINSYVTWNYWKEDPLEGGNGNDFFYDFDNKNNFYWGWGGNDLIYGRGGDDVIHGGFGNDTIVGGSGANDLVGGAGDDAIYLEGDKRIGGRYGDFAWGQDGNDLIVANVAAPGKVYDDLLVGGSGYDTVSYANAVAPLVIDMRVTSVDAELGYASGAGVGVDVIAQFEKVIAGAGDD